MHFQGSMDAFKRYNACGGEGVYLHVTKNDRVLLVRDKTLASPSSRIQQVITNALKSPLSTDKDVATLRTFVTITKMHFASSMESIATYNKHKGKGVYVHVTKDDRILVGKDPTMASSSEKISRALQKALGVLKEHKSPETSLRILETFKETLNSKNNKKITISEESRTRSFSVHGNKPDVNRSTATKIDRGINAGYQGSLKKIPLEKLVHPSPQQLVSAIIDSVGCDTFDQLHALDAMLHHALSTATNRESFFITIESLLADPLPQMPPELQYAHIQECKNDNGWFYNKDLQELDAETFSELYPDEELPDSWQEGELIYRPEQRFSDKEVDDLIFKLEEIIEINTETRKIIDAFFANNPKQPPPVMPDSPMMDRQ